MKSRHLLLSTACLLAGSMLTLLPTPTTFAEAGPTRAGADLIKPKVPQKVVAFDLNQVQLLDSAFKNAQDIDQKGLMDENLDNMLYPSAARPNSPTPAEAPTASTTPPPATSWATGCLPRHLWSGTRATRN